MAAGQNHARPIRRQHQAVSLFQGRCDRLFDIDALARRYGLAREVVVRHRRGRDGDNVYAAQKFAQVLMGFGAVFGRQSLGARQIGIEDRRQGDAFEFGVFARVIAAKNTRADHARS